jgi:hypothetical protein
MKLLKVGTFHHWSARNPAFTKFYNAKRKLFMLDVVLDEIARNTELSSRYTVAIAGCPTAIQFVRISNR